MANCQGRLIAACVAALVSTVPSRASAVDDALAIEHVTIVGIGGRAPRTDVTVVVSNGRIRDVRPSGHARLARGVRRIDATGKFLIPGLWDMHVHLFNNGSRPGTDNSARYFPLFIAHGVTGVRDMWSDADDRRLAARWEAEISAGAIAGPRVVVGSEIIDGSPATWPNSVSVANAAEARREVRRARAEGASFIKVYDRLSREAYFAIADESRRLGLPFAGHVPFSVRALEAAEAGQRSVEHLTGMSLACSTAESALFPSPELENRGAILSTLSGFDETRCRHLARTFAAHGGWQDPTLVLLRGKWLSRDPASEAAQMPFVPAAERRAWSEADARLARRDRVLLARVFAMFQAIVRSMRAERVGILAGTDLGNPHIFPGSSLHDELALMVEAGLTPAEALDTATINPARYFGRERELGTVERGKLADLVLLDGDPSRDIGNVRNIAAVISRGRYYDRAALDRLTQIGAQLAAATEETN